jgi:hypothetical protein
VELQVENLQRDRKQFKRKSITRIDWKLYVIFDEPYAAMQGPEEKRLFKMPASCSPFCRFLHISTFAVDRQTKQVLPRTRLDEDTLQVSMALKQIDAEPFVGTKEVSLPQSFKRLVSNKLWDSYKEFFAIWLQLLVRPSFFAKLIVNKKFEGLEPIKFFVLSLASGPPQEAHLFERTADALDADGKTGAGEPAADGDGRPEMWSAAPDAGRHLTSLGYPDPRDSGEMAGASRSMTTCTGWPRSSAPVRTICQCGAKVAGPPQESNAWEQ